MFNRANIFYLYRSCFLSHKKHSYVTLTIYLTIKRKMFQTNFTEENIFFHRLLENRTSKVLAILLSVLLSVFVSASASGIIWYERFGSDLQRIFTNKMVSSVCWSILGFYGFTQLPELVFYLFPGFSDHFCFFYLILRNSIVIQVSTSQTFYKQHFLFCTPFLELRLS